MKIKHLREEDFSTEEQSGSQFNDIENIVSALSFLRHEAKKTGNEELYTLINSAFSMCYTSYQLALKMACLPNGGKDLPETKN